MRICLDGSSLAFPPSGIRTYVTALVRELEATDGTIALSIVKPDGSIAQKLPRRARRFWWDGWEVASAARQSDAELLHVPQFSAPIWSTGPLVVTIHDLIPLVHPEYRQSRGMRAYLEVMRRTVARADAVIVPSSHVAGEAESMLKLHADRIHTIPMAAGIEFVPVADPSYLPPELADLGICGRYIFNIGGFDVRKNLPALLQAYARFRKETSEPFQLVIGGAPHSDNTAVFPPLLPEIERLGLAGEVLLPGLISEQIKVALYQHAAMYVTPSLSEGFGMTCLEAMACGTPTIAANRTSLPEIVGGGGILVEPEPAALAEAMLNIATDESIAAALRLAGTARASSFSWKQTAASTLNVYREVLTP